MNQQRHHPIVNRKNRGLLFCRVFSSLVAANVCLFLGSCASTTVSPPPPGSAIIDAKPDPEHRKFIEGIELVSINGKSVGGTRCVIKPGKNTVKTRFRWPKGLVQEADLRFYATPDTVYFIYYDVFPPHSKFNNTNVDDTLGGLLENSPEAFIFLALPVTVAAIAGTTAQKAKHSVSQQGHSTTYIDLMVIAPQTGQGTVRRIRAYPDGRVDEKSWAAWAQMKAPN